MSMSALRALVNNLFKKKIMRNEKKVINILTTIFISHKNGIKTFLK